MFVELANGNIWKKVVQYNHSKFNNTTQHGGTKMKTMKVYEVGDKVRIKSNLTIGDDKYGVYVNDTMTLFSGETAEIVWSWMEYKDKKPYMCYNLKINGTDSEDPVYAWTDDEFDSDGTVTKFMPKDLKSGMFGETNDTDKFVVVNDILVFKSGSYQPIADFDDNLCSGSYKIVRVKTGCKSFMQYVDSKDGTIVYNRQPPKKLTHKEVESLLGFDFEMVY